MIKSLDRMEESILPRVNKPSRYQSHGLGREPDAMADIPGGICLLFPGSWERMTSNPGFHAFLHALREASSKSPVRIDFAFSPDPDFEGLLREEQVLLFGVRSRLPLSDFHVVAAFPEKMIDLPELAGLLELGGIPARARDRGPDRPLVLVAGDAALTPEVCVFLADGFLPGDAECYAADLVRLAKETAGGEHDRELRIFRLEEIEGAFVARDDTVPQSVLPRRMGSLPPLPAHFPLGPEHEPMVVEIARPAGPESRALEPRVRDMDRAAREIEAMVAATGCGEIELAGASMHPEIVPLLETLNHRLAPHRVQVQVGALDPARLESALARELRKGIRSELVLAPVAASARLRETLGTPFSREAFLEAMKTAARGTWPGIRFSVLAGVPGETEEDRAEWMSFLEEVAGLRNKGTRLRLSLEVVPYVPRSRWETAPIPDPRALSRIVETWKTDLKRHKIRVTAGSAHEAAAETVLRKGGARGTAFLEHALERKARRQGESGGFSSDLWPETRESLPVSDASETFITLEPGETAGAWAMELAGRDSGDGFGVPAWSGGRRPKRSTRGTEARKAERFRIRFSKGEPLRFISHLDVTRAFSRAIRKSQLPVALSQGKDRRQKISFGPPLPLGMTSGAEYLDVVFAKEVPESFVRTLGESLPEGLAVVSCAPIRTEPASLNKAIQIAAYEVSFSDTLIRRHLGAATFDDLMTRLESAVDRAVAADQLKVTKVRGEETRTFNARPSLTRAQVVRDDGGRPVLELALKLNQPSSVRPELLTATLLNWTDFEERLLRVHRSGLYIPGRNKDLDPLDVVASGFKWWRQPVRGGTVL